MMHTSAKAALGTCTNLAAECKVLPEDSEYIEKSICLSSEQILFVVTACKGY
ncbi:MAG: hypothetical protein HDT30_07155 [Clostridiales bacterium]|nr:hypothetical protein [Clostridiales bacterium]